MTESNKSQQRVYIDSDILDDLFVGEPTKNELENVFEEIGLPTHEVQELKEDVILSRSSNAISPIDALANQLSDVHKRTRPQGKPEYKSDIDLRIEGLEKQFNQWKSTLTEGLGGMGGRNLVSGIGQGEMDKHQVVVPFGCGIWMM